jgi:hypothetical protein
MNKVYKIHPAIGIARVGNSSDAFFIGPEEPNHPGVEFSDDGSERPIANFKKDGFIKRQAARFRVWEYEVASNGDVNPVREIDCAQFVEWTVELRNSKAAGFALRSQIDGTRRVLVPGTQPRNQLISDRDSLTIKSPPISVGGVSSPWVDANKGKFLGRSVYLGGISTDASGRLLVMGGRGVAEGIPETPGDDVPLTSFANNDRWYDDVSDGPVTALVRIPGQDPIQAIPSWVICAPPDFAPMAHAPVSLFDVGIQAAIQRGWRNVPVIPSFVRDVLPVLKKSLSMRWVHGWHYWNLISDDWASLADPANHSIRSRAFEIITENALKDMGIPPYILDILAKWRDGNFVSDLSQPPANASIPEVLDRASLDACIATSFFPGIEAGFAMADKDLYMEPLRISHAKVKPGGLTEQMALPWQADFNDCSDDWWPSQRPNNIFVADTNIPNFSVEWSKGVGGSGNPSNRADMVSNFWKLGFIADNGSGNQLEVERDGSLPPR